MDEKTKLLIIDANSVIHRAFHALPPLTAKKGEPTNAVYGFLLVFFKAIKDFQPDFIAACFDFPAPTFRHKKFKDYKAKRPPTPKELSCQFPKIKEVLRAFNVPIFEKEGFEADDIIGTIAFLSPIETIVLSGDLDVLQVIDGKIKVYHLRKGVKDVVLYDENLVKEKFQGLFPGQIVDIKALKGDASDNIPGVLGIGEKTALELIKEFGSLESLYQQLAQKNKKTEKLKAGLKEMLLKQKKQAFLSKELARIKNDTPIRFSLKDCFWREYDKEKAAQALKELEFYSLLNRLDKIDEKENKEELRENLKLW